ncbi:EpsG family protein [Pseudaquabacterium pictum]|uniref:EpsG family protein n=1 Tax=Pseudaquabacterium pictum TaxID=2315236 RepID=A0A480AXF3_9BURK|nr:EpsG family protein [Rubrivivax pictus]GCL63488.1 hypothetical protein AQPW35_25690 [Rubrivivax pictus]
MWPYWLLFGLAAWLATTHMWPQRRFDPRWPAPWWGMFAALVLVVGLRDRVGGDWDTYLLHMSNGGRHTLAESLAEKDPAYSLLNWAVAQLGGNIYAVNTVCALLFAWGLISFCRVQPRPWLALVVAVPYLVTVVAMGYTRQGTAIGLVMLGLVALGRGQTLRFVLWTVVAATFHKSATILIPLAVLAGRQINLATLMWVVPATAGVFVLIVLDSVDALAVNYIGREYDSQGAGVRVAMNALPGAVFLLLRHRFKLLPQQQRFWTWMAMGGIVFVLLLAVSPSSTAVDRLALYWIPLQVFVWSRLPNALGQPDGPNPGWVWVTVAYSALVLAVWLFFGGHAYLWLPYRWWPVQLLEGSL